MQAGLIYDPTVADLVAEQTLALERLYDFNATRPSQGERRAELMREMFASVGERCYLEPPFHANWGGRYVHLGDDVYANFGLTLVDDTENRIGNRVMFGPNVTISTAGHPIDRTLRARAAQFNLPVTIGDDVWIGAGVLVMPGVTIGDGSVVGAGSVVTRDIPAGVVAYGSPCRVIREIGEHDREFYWRDRRVEVDENLVPIPPAAGEPA